MRKMQLFAVLMFIGLKSYGQEVVFRYDIKRDSDFHIKSNKSIGNNFLGMIRNYWDNVDPGSVKTMVISRNFTMKNPTLETDVISYRTKGAGCYYLQDIWGHEILLDPSLIKDTIRLIVNQNHFYKNYPDGKPGPFLNDSISASTIFNIQYPPKYKYIGFFDSLAYLHGGLRDMRFGYSFKELGNNLPKYLKGITQIYKDRVKFLQDFLRKYSMPASLQLYARKEIQYSFYDDLLVPLVEWDMQLYSEYPKALQDTINSFRNDLGSTALFENTTFFRSVLVKYFALINSAGIRGPMNFNDSFLNKARPYLKKMPAGGAKSYLTVWLMQGYQGNADVTAINTIYQDYKSDPTQPSLNQLIDSIYQAVKHPGFSAGEMLNLTFENDLHTSKTLAQLTTSKVILIDCWATWCIPCINQLPFLDAIVKKYKNKVQFIALSADQDSKRWDTWINKNNSGRPDVLQLHAKGGFENIFFKQMMIKVIPRYILLSNSGEVLNRSMPLPSDTEQFERELNKYL